jgi:hypothetical protein
VDALQDAASGFPVASPPLQDLVGRGMTTPPIHLESFLQERIDIPWNRVLGKYLGVAQTKQDTSRRLDVAANSAGTQMLLLQLCSQLLDVCLKASERRPTPLCNTKQMVNRCGVIGSPMLQIVRTLAVTESKGAALPTQVLLQIRRRHGLQWDAPLTEITQEHPGNTNMAVNRVARQAFIVGESFP